MLILMVTTCLICICQISSRQIDCMNKGQCRFLEESTIRGVAGPLASGPCVSFDQDNDGDLDLFVTYQHHYRPIRAVAAFYIENRIEDDHQRFFENDGNGYFIDSTEKHGLNAFALPPE